VVAGTAGYCFGNLLLPDYNLPWECSQEFYPSNFASPRDVCIEASNGASDYGNKFGEPVLTGFARSFGLRLPDGSYYGDLFLSVFSAFPFPSSFALVMSHELIFI
jgi:phosphoribosylformylglycinamidine synthase